MGRKLFVGCGFLVLKIFDIFLILEELVFFFIKLYFGYRLTRMTL